jgi:hypothetical protein
MEEVFRLRTRRRFRHYFRDTYRVHGRPFCPLLDRDIGMLVSIGILLPQKDKETFVVSPEFLAEAESKPEMSSTPSSNPDAYPTGP